VTALSHASSSSLKKNKFKKKRNIKSRKIDKRKRKMLMSKVSHNILRIAAIFRRPNSVILGFPKDMLYLIY